MCILSIYVKYDILLLNARVVRVYALTDIIVENMFFSTPYRVDYKNSSLKNTT